MHGTEQRALEGRRILLLEDDIDLNKRLASAFKYAGASEVVIRRSAESGLERMKLEGGEYDLIVIDAMLPKTEGDVESIDALDRDLITIRETLQREESRFESQRTKSSELLETYMRRRAILTEREMLIQDRGGLDMVENWMKKAPKPQVSPPILFLTAVGSREAVERGRKLLGPFGEWLVKPVTTDTIIKVASQSISKGKWDLPVAE